MPTPQEAENLVGVFRSTLSGRMIECNEAFTLLLGHRTREETLQHNAWEFCADAAERDRLLKCLGRERRVTNHETRWRRGDGAEVTLMMNATRLGDGPDAQVEGIMLDVTERKRTEDALREREAQLRSLGNNLPDGVIYQVVRRPDGSNYFPYMSSGLERTFGVSAAEAMRDASILYRLVPPEDLQRIRAAADASILANAAAHEINNPLAVIVGQLELIEKRKNVAEGIRRVRTAALRIRDIVNHMTRITRLEWPSTASPSLPRMLDIRRSGPHDDPGPPS